MIIAMIYDHPRWEEKHMIKIIEDAGHKALHVPLRSTTFDLTDLKRKADVAIQRAISSVRAITSTAYFEASGTPVVNNLNTQIICDNKVLTDLALE